MEPVEGEDVKLDIDIIDPSQFVLAQGDLFSCDDISPLTTLEISNVVSQEEYTVILSDGEGSYVANITHENDYFVIFAPNYPGSPGRAR